MTIIIGLKYDYGVVVAYDKANLVKEDCRFIKDGEVEKFREIKKGVGFGMSGKYNPDILAILESMLDQYDPKEAMQKFVYHHSLEPMDFMFLPEEYKQFLFTHDGNLYTADNKSNTKLESVSHCGFGYGFYKTLEKHFEDLVDDCRYRSRAIKLVKDCVEISAEISLALPSSEYGKIIEGCGIVYIESNEHVQVQ